MPKYLRRPAGLLCASLLGATILLVASATHAPAGASALPQGALAPTDAQRAIARRIGVILQEAHYRHQPIDDLMSVEIFDRYLRFLDGQHSYFLASDIADFSDLKMRFDDMIHSGEVDPAYGIFARFQQRNRERMQYALSLLATEPNWELDEQFSFDREKSPWAASRAELDEVWRKRVKNDALSLLLAGKTWAEASDLLRKRYEHVLKRVDQITPEDVF